MKTVTFLGGGLVAAGLALGATGTAGAHGWAPTTLQHLGSFSVPANLPADADPATPTSAEIIDVTRDGRTAIYTDSLAGRLGFIDIATSTAPVPGGSLTLDGEPTSVAVAGRYALVGVNTSESFANPSGNLLVLDTADRSVVATLPLAGQPDSVAVSPDGRYAAIVIENERDEDVDGGLIPQDPAGTLQLLRITGAPQRWARSLKTVDLTGLSVTAPDDPEPEFVDINRRNEAVVSLQENNWLVVVDVRTGTVKRSFSAGTVSADGIDTVQEELGPQAAPLLELDGLFTDRRREPDAVHWIDDDTFATANEGDYEDADGQEGGTRSFTLFHEDGRVEYEAGTTLEHRFVSAGHFPEGRADAKGIEPEGLEVARVHGRPLLFVGSERGNAVAVYDVSNGTPRYVQLLPTGIGPEGLRWVPGRDLFLATSEVDGADDGFQARPQVTVYGPGESRYPDIASANDATGRPIPWTALSGLAGDRQDPTTMWAVSDSALAQGWLYRIDLRTKTIVQRLAVGGPDGRLDLEGVATRPEGGFWVAGEGLADPAAGRPNQVVRLAADGSILETVELPEGLVAGATNSGLEGVTVTGSEAGGDETLYVVIQREWADDPAGSVKLGRYDVGTGTWTFARYPLDAVASPAGGWVGLSEITLLPDGHTAAIIERDDRIAQDARIKRIQGVDLAASEWRALDDPRGLATVHKTLLRDVLGDLDLRSISVPDKLEGLGLTTTGRVYVVTDNDGVDENYGETLFFSPGRAGEVLGG